MHHDKNIVQVYCFGWCVKNLKEVWSLSVRTENLGQGNKNCKKKY